MPPTCWMSQEKTFPKFFTTTRNPTPSSTRTSSRLEEGDIGAYWEHRVGEITPEAVTLRDEETGIPNHNPHTMETNVPGAFIAGVLAAGNNANKIFIENGRAHGGQIVQAIIEGGA